MGTVLILFIIWVVYSLYDENIGNDNRNWKSDIYQNRRKSSIEKGIYHYREHDRKMHGRFGYAYDPWAREYDLHGTIDGKWPEASCMTFSEIRIYHKVPEETLRETYKLSEPLWKELNTTGGKYPHFLYMLLQRLVDEDFREYSDFFPKERPVIENLDLEEIVEISGLEEDVFLYRYFLYYDEVFVDKRKQRWVDPVLLRLEGFEREDRIATLALLERVVKEDTLKPWCDYTKWGKGYYDTSERHARG